MWTLYAAAGVLVLYVLVRRMGRGSGETSVRDLYLTDGAESLLGPDTDWAFLDEYLTKWDQFACGRNELVPQIRSDVARFNAELARALEREPNRALTPAIMYPLLQVGGFVPLDSAVGQALTRAFGTEAPAVTTLKGEQYYFAGDLYLWRERHASQLPPYALYDDWRGREMTVEKVIPMYTAVAQRASDA